LAPAHPTGSTDYTAHAPGRCRFAGISVTVPVSQEGSFAQHFTVRPRQANWARDATSTGCPWWRWFNRVDMEAVRVKQALKASIKPL
jgi:hypothetical protein